MSITSDLVSLSLCALVGGAVLHWMSSSKEVALASYPAQIAEGSGSSSYSMPVPPPVPPSTAPPPAPPISPIAASPQGSIHGVVPSLPSLVITSCNGVPGSANLRDAPSLYGTVLSVIPQGDPVLLLGDSLAERRRQRAWGDGEEWIYVRTATLQEGWIAACFERG